MKFKRKKAASATTKDIGNGNIKEMTRPVTMYIPIHFSR
jgi:hypothetical protein